MKPLQHRVATKNQQLTEHLQGWDSARLDGYDDDDGISIPEFNHSVARRRANEAADRLFGPALGQAMRDLRSGTS